MRNTRVTQFSEINRITVSFPRKSEICSVDSCVGRPVAVMKQLPQADKLVERAQSATHLDR